MSVRAPGPRLEACRPAADCGPGTPRVHWLDTRLRAAGTPQQRRQHARGHARAALGARLAQALGCDAQDLWVTDERGQAPTVGWCGSGSAPAALARIGLSISHAPGVSLVAWHPGGAVGVDLQPLPLGAGLPELLDAAALYLPPGSAAALGRQAPGARAIEAFAECWAAHEARLKCAGRALAEWSPALAAALAGVRAVPLRLPQPLAAGHAAAVAWRGPPR